MRRGHGMSWWCLLSTLGVCVLSRLWTCDLVREATLWRCRALAFGSLPCSWPCTLDVSPFAVSCRACESPVAAEHHGTNRTKQIGGCYRASQREDESPPLPARMGPEKQFLEWDVAGRGGMFFLFLAGSTQPVRRSRFAAGSKAGSGCRRRRRLQLPTPGSKHSSKSAPTPGTEAGTDSHHRRRHLTPAPTLAPTPAPLRLWLVAVCSVAHVGGSVEVINKNNTKANNRKI